MTERREKLEIVRDILSAIYEKKGRIKPTHLLYKSNLAHNKLKIYLGDLIQKELVKEENQDRSKMYLITEKGIKFLNEYKRVQEFMESFGL